MMWRLFFDKFQRTEIYTDGSCKQGRGAWAYVVTRRGKVVAEASAKIVKTNSHRMEFQAAIEALQSFEKPVRARLFSDSRNLVDTMNLWLPEWKANAWKRSRGQVIPGLQQVQTLDLLNQRHQITWQWVRAHSGNTHNERCDELCIIARS